MRSRIRAAVILAIAAVLVPPDADAGGP